MQDFGRARVVYHESTDQYNHILQEIKLKLPCAEPLGYYGPVLQLDNVSCGWDKYVAYMLCVALPPPLLTSVLSDASFS